MLRKKVYKLIDEEREYQDKNAPLSSFHHDNLNSVSEWLIYIEEQILQCKNAIYHLNDFKAKCHIRKIAALVVACMENLETPSRKEEKDNSF